MKNTFWKAKFIIGRNLGDDEYDPTGKSIVYVKKSKEAQKNINYLRKSIHENVA
jgi:hypothetical protein